MNRGKSVSFLDVGGVGTADGNDGAAGFRRASAEPAAASSSPSPFRMADTAQAAMVAAAAAAATQNNAADTKATAAVVGNHCYQRSQSSININIGEN